MIITRLDFEYMSDEIMRVVFFINHVEQFSFTIPILPDKYNPKLTYEYVLEGSLILDKD